MRHGGFASFDALTCSDGFEKLFALVRAIGLEAGTLSAHDPLTDGGCHRGNDRRLSASGRTSSMVATSSSTRETGKPPGDTTGADAYLAKG